MGLTLVAYLIADEVMAVAHKMRKELEYSIKVRDCSLACEIASHPRVVSTLHNDISYKLYIVRSANQIPMDGRCFHTFSDAFDWATGNGSLAPSNRCHEFGYSRQPFEGYSWSVTVPELKHHIVPEIKRIEQNLKNSTFYTTVIWADGSKPTVVKCAEDDSPDFYFAVASAIAIKMYGSNSAYKRMIKEKYGGMRI